jgi:hypothetical protein
MGYHIRQALVVLLLVICNSLTSQTSDQARSFINRSHIAIAKSQKEIYRSGKTVFDNDFKKSIKYQTIALKLFKENKLSEAVVYSYKARNQSMNICAKLGTDISEFNLNNDEMLYFNGGDGKSTLDSNILSSDELKKIQNLDILDVAKFLEIELSIK